MACCTSCDFLPPNVGDLEVVQTAPNVGDLEVVQTAPSNNAAFSLGLAGSQPLIFVRLYLVILWHQSDLPGITTMGRPS